MKGLKREYIKVPLEKEISYGGSQSWLPYRFLKKSACGVIGALDAILYLQGRSMVSKEEYLNRARELWRWYLPVIPGFGINGLSLVFGMNRYFYKKKLPYRASWKVSGKKMIRRIDELLEKDLPVILAVGPNFPNFWGKEKLIFYRKNIRGAYDPAVKTKAHFVTVTGRDGMWLRISSWGKEYYIHIHEFQDYVKNDSCPLVSNIVCITERKQIQ